MAERIIPIQILDNIDDNSSSGDSMVVQDNIQSELSKSLEDLKVDTPDLPASPQLTSSNSPLISISKINVKPKIQKVDANEIAVLPTTLQLTCSNSPIKTVEASLSRVNVKPKVKPAPPPPPLVSEDREYLKCFDVFERRDGNLTLADFGYPAVDVKERIFLVIDRAQDENFTPFTVGTENYKPLSVVKRSISTFIKLKLGINPNHEFAIIVLNRENAELLLDFTNDSKRLNEALLQVRECQTEDIFNLDTAFDIIQRAEVPESLAPGLPPAYVLRTILFYGRSYTKPKMTEELLNYFKYPFTICDVLMTHEAVEVSNHCQEIFDELQKLDQKGVSYFFPVGRDMRRINKCVGKLLGHPFQRPLQKLIKN